MRERPSTSAIAKIASIKILGTANGTAGGTDHFGIIAEQIVSLKIGDVAQASLRLATNEHQDAAMVGQKEPIGHCGQLSVVGQIMRETNRMKHFS